MSREACRVYEQASIHALTGSTIRPGGMALTERALRQAPLEPGARVLDVGCGHAATLERLLATQPVRAAGLDLSHRQLRAAPPGLALTQAAGDTLPFAAGQFDALLAECCLSLIADGERALAEFARVLRGGGTLILSDIYARNAAEIPAARRLPLACCLSQALSREWLLAALPRHGLRVSLWEDHTPALRSLAGQIIFAHGSLAAFWQVMLAGSQLPGGRQLPGGSPAEADCSQQAEQVAATTARLKPGYFLLLAQKDA